MRSNDETAGATRARQWIIQIGFDCEAFQSLNYEIDPTKGVNGYYGNQLVGSQNNDSPANLVERLQKKHFDVLGENTYEEKDASFEMFNGGLNSSPEAFYGQSSTYFMDWWTIFYWGWWIAWSPFVAVFIARISRGRTLREFVLGVLLAPTGLALLWITLFGSTGMYIELFGDGGVVEAVNKDTTTALFKTIDLMNLGPWLTTIMASICTIMLVTYFVTSADSATLVICTLIAMGEPEPAPRLRIFWGLAVGAVAAVLLYAGGLKALQTASIVAALPFSFVLIMAAYGLFKSLHAEPVFRKPETITQE